MPKISEPVAAALDWIEAHPLDTANRTERARRLVKAMPSLELLVLPADLLSSITMSDRVVEALDDSAARIVAAEARRLQTEQALALKHLGDLATTLRAVALWMDNHNTCKTWVLVPGVADNLRNWAFWLDGEERAPVAAKQGGGS